MQIPLVFYPDSFYFTVTLMDAFLLLYVFTVIVAVPFLNAVISLICREFGVNENWLRNGIEPQYIETPSSTMEQLKKEFNLDEFGYNLVYEYLKLDQNQRDAVRKFLYDVIEKEPDIQQENNTSQEACSVEEAEAAYIKSRSKSVRKMAQSALNTTEESAKLKDAVNQ